jgi:hypothetical protein
MQKQEREKLMVKAGNLQMLPGQQSRNKAKLVNITWETEGVEDDNLCESYSAKGFHQCNCGKRFKK